MASEPVQEPLFGTCNVPKGEKMKGRHILREGKKRKCCWNAPSLGRLELHAPVSLTMLSGSTQAHEGFFGAQGRTEFSERTRVKKHGRLQCSIIFCVTTGLEREDDNPGVLAITIAKQLLALHCDKSI